MFTLILDEPGRLHSADTPGPGPPGPGEALVRVHRVGICGTDIHAFKGEQPFFSYPRILGHELGVEVLEVGENVNGIKAGDRCAVEPYMTCGVCPPCRAGRTNCCHTLKCLGVQTDGGMRERIIVPAAKLHRSDILDYDALALVETLGIGRHAVNRAELKPGGRVAVLGLGPIGLCVATFAQLAGADVIGLDINPQRIETAKSLLGIKTLALETDEEVSRQWADAYGDPPATVFEATGNRTSMLKAFDLPVHGGTLVFVGLVLGELSFDDPSFHRKELTLKSSRNALGHEFKQIIGLIEEGRIDTSAWITHRCDAQALPERFRAWTEPSAKVLKAMVSLT